jgi:hypothetical protein
LKTRVAIAAAVIGLSFAGAMPAHGDFGDWAGTGAVAGTLAYDGMPDKFEDCEVTPFELTLDTPAFTLHTPSGPVVAPLRVRGRGADTCGSEELSSANFAIQLDVGDLHCDMGATYIRVAAHFQMTAGADSGCTFRGDPAPSYNWVFELAYVDGIVAGSIAWVA